MGVNTLADEDFVNDLPLVALPAASRPSDDDGGADCNDALEDDNLRLDGENMSGS